MKNLLVALITILGLPTSASAAIALDTAVSGGAAASWSHTVTGSNTALVVTGYNITDCGMTATYNGTSMTLVGKTTFPGTGRQGAYLFLLINPSSGSHTVSLSCGKGIGSVSYTGVKQTGQPDSSNTGTTAGATSPVVLTTTVVAANSWLVGVEADGAGGKTANTGTTIRETDANGLVQADSNGGVSTGSQSLSLNVGATSVDRGWVIASLSPAASATPNTGSFWFWWW